MSSPTSAASRPSTSERALSSTASAISGVGHPTASPSPEMPSSVSSSTRTFVIPRRRP